MKIKLFLIVLLSVSAIIFATESATGNFLFSPTESPDLFFEQLFIEYATLSGSELDSLGDMTPFGVPHYQDKMKDLSGEAIEKYYAMLHAALEKINTFDFDAYDTQTKYNLETIKWFLENKIAGEPFMYHEAILAPLIGFEGEMYDIFLNQIVIESVEDAEDFIARMPYVQKKTDQVIAIFHESIDKGMLMNTASIRASMNTLYDLRMGASYSKTYARYKKQVNQLNLSSEEKKRLLAEGLKGMNDYFVPAMKKLHTTLQNSLSIPNAESGVWHYPNGDDYYRYALKTNTTLDLDPEALHEFGKAEVEKIRKRIAELYAILGSNTTINTDESIMDHMNDLFYDEFQPEYLPEIQVYYATMYSPPRIDGKTKGIYFSTTGTAEENSVYFHEAVPGHHLERTYNLRMENMPMIRHMCFFTAYIEGWALYSERLAWETMADEKLKRELDYLQNLLLRAKRIVADTGINYKRWTRSQTVAYMLEDGFSRGLVESDVNRYITWPGQACAYYVGYTKLMELREVMEEKYGADFNLKDFHKLILENGQMPLEILEKKFMESL
jgi:uncharacterized protein (DUF885 family)